MLFNPLFLQIGVNANPADSSKSTKLNNTSYLFSDIIRVFGNNGKAADSLSEPSGTGNGSIPVDLLNNFDINALTSQVAGNDQSHNSLNLTDLLKELLSNIQAGKSGDISSLESYLAKPGEKNIHLLSSGNDLDAFLQKLFSALPELKMVAGGDKNFIVKPVSGKTGEVNQDQKKQVEDAIINLLQTNNNIVLNFNLGSEQFKIEITKLSGSVNIKSPAETVSESSSKTEQTPKNTTGPITDVTGGIAGQRQVQISEGPEVYIKSGNTLPQADTPCEKNGSASLNEIQGNMNAADKSAAVPVAAENTGEIPPGKTNGKAVNTAAGDSYAPPIVENKISAGGPAVPIDGIPAEGDKKIVLPPEPGPANETAVEAPQNNGNSGGSIAKNKGLTLNAEDQKYILSIKVESPQTATEEIKNNVTGNQKIKNIDTINRLPENNNAPVEPAAAGDLKAEGARLLQNGKSIDPGKELFNPPLTLKLSLKQQIKNVEQTKLDSTKIIFEKDGNAAKTNHNPAESAARNGTKNIKADGQNVKDNAGTNKSNGTEVKDNLKAARNDINVQEQAAQVIAETANPVPDNYPENINPDPVKTADSVSSEISGTIDKNLKGPDSTKEDNSNSTVRQIDRNVNGNDNAAASAENAGTDSGNKSYDEKQKGGGLKTGTTQTINDFEKFMSVKDKIPDKPNQFASTLRTIKVADITKEFASIINQRQSKSVVLQLKPENLGKIKLSIDVTNNMVHARVEVENESVKQMLQSNLDVLRHSLNLSGLQLSTIDVSMSGGQQKSYKSYGAKKKSQYTGKNTKITEEPETKVNKNMGYNTYEYLI